MTDKEKTTARNCSVGAEHEQSFFIIDRYSISDYAAGFNSFLHQFPFLLSGRRKIIESQNI